MKKGRGWAIFKQVTVQFWQLWLNRSSGEKYSRLNFQAHASAAATIFSKKAIVLVAL